MWGDQRLSDEKIAGEQQSISQNAPHKRNQRLALEPIWFWLAGSLPNVPDELPRAAAMADLQSSGSLPPLRRSKSRRTAWGVGAIRSALRCSKPIAKPVIIPSSKSICRILAPTSAPRPSSAPLLPPASPQAQADFCTSANPRTGRNGSCRRPPAELSPIIHEVTALLEKIAAPIGRLDRIADGVGEGLLDNVVRVRSRLSRPISEGAAKAMHRHIASPHLLQHIRHGHVTKAGSSAGPNEHM